MCKTFLPLTLITLYTTSATKSGTLQRICHTQKEYIRSNLPLLVVYLPHHAGSKRTCSQHDNIVFGGNFIHGDGKDEAQNVSEILLRIGEHKHKLNCVSFQER